MLNDAQFFHIRTREDKFESRYFDFQRSHKYVVELDEQTKIATAAYEHFLKGAPVDLAIDIATMAGCPMGCAFCASSSIDFRRTLTAAEMMAQGHFFIDRIATPSIEQITCSFQGSGEPTLVAEQVIAASKGMLAIDRRVVLSLSTIGANLCGLKALVQSGLEFHNIQLTLCGTTEEVVSSFMPKALHSDDLVKVAKKLTSHTNLRKVKANYILLADFNDSEADLDYLVRAFRGSRIIVKISCLNETRGSRARCLKSGSKDVAITFKNKLVANGIDSFVFGSFRDIQLSCGQLTELEGEWAQKIT